ncbi:hypothetical protein QUF76_19330, partial [Desulfobacterales bacterium HSG16]|nr:hypothetical protein [Desulfobacterales bacterium HSG16]
MIELIKDSLIKLYKNHNTESEHESRDRVEGWLTEIENVDLIFDCYSTEKQYNRLKNGKNDKKKLKQLKKLYRRQKQMLDFFSKDLNRASFARTRQLCQTANAGSKGRRLIIEGKKTGLINRIRASYQMMSVYDRYCPPLIPQLIIQYITTPGVRKSIEIRLNRLRQFYGKSFSTIPLKKAVVNAKTLNKDKTRQIFLRFLRGFIRFHRDYQSYLSVKQAMDNINLTFADRIIHLSRANNTLHEFLLPGERTREEKPIINHVVIKADIRGSTDITHHMMEMGLNPASFFSLNFFDPIRKILPEYDALKVFVEGDAMILSIFERERTPDKWYCVARACGLAADILAIVNRYNVKSVQNKLPIIELGIGVSFKKGMPAFLFDGEHRIMISSA